MKNFRIPFLFMASLILGYFAGQKRFVERYSEEPTGDRRIRD